MANIKKILIATDLSENATRVVQEAELLARAISAELLLLHVVDTSHYFAAADVGYSPASVLQAHKTAMESGLQLTAHELTRRGVPASFRLEFGTPHDCIVETARMHQADLIMMGTHGRTGIRHAVMGSVAERVARLASVPVMTFRGDV